MTEMDMSKRTLLKMAGTTLVVGPAAAYLAAIAGHKADSDYAAHEKALLKLEDTPNVEAAKVLFGGAVTNIYSGEGNQKAIQQRNFNSFKYHDAATIAFNTAHYELFKSKIHITIVDELEAVPDDFVNQGNWLHLGGPTSNLQLAKILNYKANATKIDGGVKIPFTDSNFRLPFEHLHGETKFGEFEGQIRFATRTKTTGELVSRAQGAIRDHRTEKIHLCQTKGDRLASEYLQVIKLKEGGKQTLFVWGLHGMSLENFVRQDIFYKNLDKLAEFTAGMTEFHALIPMSVNFVERITEKDRYDAICEPDWDAVSRHKFIVDLTKWKNV